MEHADILFEVQKDTQNVHSKLLKTKNGRTLLLSKCAACRSKKSRFMKGQEPKGILNTLGRKAQLSKILLLREILL